jgi:protein SCO1/2
MARCTAWLAAVIIVVAAMGAGCGGGGDLATVELGGWVREPLPEVGSVELPDVGNEGVPLAMRAPVDGLLLVYFGFASCPDVCPTTLADVGEALELLGDDAGNVEVAFVTVDPDRDAPDTLEDYVGFFVGDAGHALRTEDPAVLRAAADRFGAAYEHGVDDSGRIEVSHTAHLYAVDPAGRLLVTWPFGVEPGVLAADLAVLLDDPDVVLGSLAAAS